MLFTEFSFIFLFLPLALCAFYAAPTIRAQLVAVSIASLIFYGAWNARLVPVLCFAIIVNYLIALRIERSGRRRWFIAGIVLALTPLVYFKYSGFLAHSLGLELTTGLFGEELGTLLPLGISFYTFQQITYLSDVRLGRIKPGRFVEYAFFKLFFPQLIAGPIVHYHQLVPQIGRAIDRERMFMAGAILFGIGFVKKFFVADGFAAFSDPLFDGKGPLGTEDALIATLGFTFQLYFDFSGYSDMALGLAALFGFQLPVNFNSPYKAKSISDFWRRWHITLSQFLRDYIYIPLGGNRGGELLRYRNLLLTMLIGGLWHGAAWTFVVWGGLHGLGLAVNHLWTRFVRVPLFGAGWLLTFVFVALLWVLFKARDFERALDVYQGFLAFDGIGWTVFWVWAAGGLAATTLLPNSQQIVGWASERISVPGLEVGALARRIGAYAALSGVVLYGLTAAYYTTPLERRAFSLLEPEPPYRSDDVMMSGDLRNNLWRRPVFTVDPPRIVLAGSSFVAATGRFQVTDASGRRAVSQNLGFPGNGILNGARVVDAVVRGGAADIIFLGVSPLNFGSNVRHVPFPGECMENLAAAAGEHGYKLEVRPLSSCFPSRIDPLAYLGVFSSDRSSVHQFREFVHILASSRLGGQDAVFPEFSIQRPALAGELARIRAELSLRNASFEPVASRANGRDAQFHWRDRGVLESLRPGGLDHVLFGYIARLSAERGVRLIVYETPTSRHEDAPDIYPAGFFEDYQSALRATLAELGVPYIDLSGLFPWNGAIFGDFVHVWGSYRPMIHEVLLAWLFAPEVLRASGLVPPERLPEAVASR